ncbi:hypothetical protein B0H19DRAFT_1157086 [Mycena capillaripes]|nr:hypothetical protein B0H19DRAFT_1157086 [Mycena capillaripes]
MRTLILPALCAVPPVWLVVPLGVPNFGQRRCARHVDPCAKAQAPTSLSPPRARCLTHLRMLSRSILNSTQQPTPSPLRRPRPRPPRHRPLVRALSCAPSLHMLRTSLPAL